MTRMRDLLYTVVLLTAAALMVLLAVMPALAQGNGHGKGHADLFEPGMWPAPVVSGGAMPVQWTDISNPTPTDHFGLYAPEASDADPLEWSYVSCSQTAVVARATGTCGFIIPSTVPPGTYEIRLFAGSGAKLAKSPKFEVLDGGWR